MKVSGEKIKVIATSCKSIINDEDLVEINVDETLEEVKTFRYLGSTLHVDVISDNEIMKKLTIATDQLHRLNTL